MRYPHDLGPQALLKGHKRLEYLREALVFCVQPLSLIAGLIYGSFRGSFGF